MQKLYKSDASAAIHETAQGLYEHAIIDEKSIHEFDESCLASPALDERRLLPQVVTDAETTRQSETNRGIFSADSEQQMPEKIL